MTLCNLYCIDFTGERHTNFAELSLKTPVKPEVTATLKTHGVQTEGFFKVHSMLLCGATFHLKNPQNLWIKCELHTARGRYQVYPSKVFSMNLIFLIIVFNEFNLSTLTADELINVFIAK